MAPALNYLALLHTMTKKKNLLEKKSHTSAEIQMLHILLQRFICHQKNQELKRPESRIKLTYSTFNYSFYLMIHCQSFLRGPKISDCSAWQLV